MSNPPLSQKDIMPVLFVGHGSPMNVIEDNEFTQGWQKTAALLPKPEAIICISAHWLTEGTKVTAMKQPKTIYDFYGFPQELYNINYPAPGAPEIAEEIKNTVKGTNIKLDYDWGLDHGTWSVLIKMFTEANIPVLQLSLDDTQPPEFHYNLGKELTGLRKKGILVIGSGNIVHNLRMINWNNEPLEWAIDFDKIIKDKIIKNDHKSIIEYQKLGKIAELAVPTNEHFLPLLYILALKDEEDEITFFNETCSLGSLSMTSLIIDRKNTSG